MTFKLTTAIVLTAALIGWEIYTRKQRGFGFHTHVGLMLLISAVAAWIGVGVIYFTNPSTQPSPFSDSAKALADAVNNNRPENIRQLTATGVNPNAVMLDGTTVLHAACGMGKVECVKALLDGGADVHIADAKGRTPLHFVAECGMSADAQKDITALLLQAGANPNAKDAQGNTPMAVATRSGNSACAQVLQNHLSPASVPHE